MDTVIDTVVFDLGGVLFDWNPRHLYRELFGGDDLQMEWFLSEVCTRAWIERQDAGRSFADGVRELTAKFPKYAPHIAAFDRQWHRMLAGPIPGTVEVLECLASAGVRLYALTNWSSEKFPVASCQPFMRHFHGAVVSGDEGIIKPNPDIWALLEQRFDVEPARSVYIDDSAPNVEVAAARGYTAIQFFSPGALAGALARCGLPVQC